MPGRFLHLVLLTALASGAVAQDRSVPVRASAAGPSIVDVALIAGQPASVFSQRFGEHTLASFHYGEGYDVTYWIVGLGLLTVEFVHGRAGLFRLITRRGSASPEALALMLGIDTSRLELVEELDVKKVWRGRIGGMGLAEVCAVTSPEGWTRAEVKMAGLTPD